jgi:tRNA(Ile)-lysidine synthase
LAVPDPGPSHILTRARAQDDVAAMIRRLRPHLAGAALPQVGLAVSGGSDSTALMHLAAEVAPAAGVRLRVVTVDHGLRAASAAEAVAVSKAAARLGLAHTTLHWQRAKVGGNLPALARAGRYGAMSDWARAEGVGAILLGHTADDLAEGVLLRLARRAGADGLAAMRDVFSDASGVFWARPLLAHGRAALREILLAQGIGWADDPTNADPAYARVRARHALRALALAGISPEDLAASARNLRSATDALGWHAAEAAGRVFSSQAGDLVADAAAFADLPAETRRRLLAGALAWIAGAGYAPRQPALLRLEAAALAGRRAQLAGCRLEPAPGGFRLGREARAVADVRGDPAALWDGRWRLHGPAAPKGAWIAALGAAGLRLCPAWRAAGLPRASQLAAPALWHEGGLLAAPSAGRSEGWAFSLAPARSDFASSLLSAAGLAH